MLNKFLNLIEAKNVGWEPVHWRNQAKMKQLIKKKWGKCRVATGMICSPSIYVSIIQVIKVNMAANARNAGSNAN